MRSETRVLSRAPTRRAASRIAVAGVLALLSVVAAPVLVPRTAFADHDGLYAVCPDPIVEGNSDRMGIRRSGYKVLEAFAFTDSRYHTADPDDFTEYHGVKFTQSEGNTLWIPIETTADTRPEHDETFAIGFWDGGVWHSCVVTITDDDAPRIISVELITSPLDGWAYRAGDTIDVAVTVDANVEVEGSPQLALFLGDNGASTWRGASYLRGSGTRELVFRYRVQPEDLATDGISVGAAATSDDRTPAYGFAGTINAIGTDAPIDYTHAGIARSWTQRVDGRPYVQSTRTISAPEAGQQFYRANEAIEFEFTFNTRVVVEGDVSVTLYLGYDGYHSEGTARQADYRRGSGTDTLLFGYTVRPGDMDPRGIMLGLGSPATGFSGSGTIKAEGTDVERYPWYRGTGPQSEHRVDTAAPLASSVTITSQPANGEAYAAGETISVEVAFSESVTVTGTSYLDLDIGRATRRAMLAADQGPSSRLVFEYEVHSGDADTDGVGIDANSLRLSGGAIHDRAGNAANLSHATVTADATQRVAT